MKKKKNTCLIEALKQMTVEQLDETLQAELRKEDPDAEVVLPILSELRYREADDLETTVQPAAVKPRKRRAVIAAAAVAAAICVLIAVVPGKADADDLMSVLLRVTQSVLQFFSPDDHPDDLQVYVFETDNPDLQRLHDEVVRLGVTDPVVPMWLPEGSVMTELKVIPVEGITKVYAQFGNGDRSVLISYKISPLITTTQYERRDTTNSFEAAGIGHAIVENSVSCTAAWTREGVECQIAVDSDREELQKIIRSIYRRNTA